MSKFQITVTAIFIICIVAGVIAFSTYKGGSGVAELPSISIWGTFPQSLFDQYVAKINNTASPSLKIAYTQVPETSFDSIFIEALASGRGPDVILIPQDLLHRHEDKIVPIPYTTLPQRDFQTTFVQQAELYLGANGTLALPFVIDPLVMYWNRDSFTNVGVASPPQFWDEFNNLNTKLTQKDVNSNIRKSAIALGEFSNISHAREILGTVFMQSGNPVTYRNTSGTISSALGTGDFSGLVTSLPALNFFTQFSNPSSQNYSWNRSLPNSKSSFLSGALATYFGFASEIKDLRTKNPNIDFDVAPLPQARAGKNRITYATMYGFSIVRSSPNVNAAFTVLTSLISSTALSEMVTMSYLPPVRRDMITTGSTDPYLSIFYNSALISRSWLDSNKVESERIFKDIVESVSSGSKVPLDALQDGSNEFDLSLKGSI